MSKRVLYVDDHAANRLLVKRIVEAEGHILLEAEDGKKGWETAVSQQPDLILMDLHLPGSLSGFELTHRIKMSPQLSHIPVVALTAYGHADAEVKALAAGCVGFLHKPVDIRQIRDVLRQYMHHNTASIINSTAPNYTFATEDVTGYR